ncbi:solute carrier family 46 member 3-like [Mya arenaria]|uniref:solute carrier family 46 member 3-like n=1 Tax=Mya arenaria TaxID=6604 RepID=UPI0022E11E06|nr:solute carrier family 46 member 3-like [Mya arenaria]
MDDVVNENETGVKGKLVGGRVLSWRRFLVGPVMVLYMTGYMISYFTITEYTNAYWKHRKLNEANLADNVTSSENKCDVNASDPAYKVEDEATSTASEYIVYYSLAQGLPGIVSNLVLGAYTDAFGRRFLLGIGITGTTVRLILSVIIIYFEANLLYFIGACLIEGCTGQFTTTTQACFVYMGDITDTPAKRTYGMAYVMISIATSLTISTYIAGYLIQTFSFLVAMAVAAAILVLALITMMTLLPESYPPEKRTKSRSIKTMLKNSASFFVTNDERNNRWKYQLLVSAHALSEFGFIGRIGVETLYYMAHPFCWSSKGVGLYMAGRTLVVSVFGIGLVGVYRKFLSDVALTMLSTASYAVCFLFEALAATDMMLYIAIAVGCFSGLESVMVRSIASVLTPADRQGALFSALAAVDVTINLLSNVFTGTIYSVTVNYVRGAVFYVLVAVELMSCSLLSILLVKWNLEKRKLNIQKI